MQKYGESKDRKGIQRAKEVEIDRNGEWVSDAETVESKVYKNKRTGPDRVDRVEWFCREGAREAWGPFTDISDRNRDGSACQLNLPDDFYSERVCRISLCAWHPDVASSWWSRGVWRHKEGGYFLVCVRVCVDASVNWCSSWLIAALRTTWRLTALNHPAVNYAIIFERRRNKKKK